MTSEVVSNEYGEYDEAVNSENSKCDEKEKEREDCDETGMIEDEKKKGVSKRKREKKIKQQRGSWRNRVRWTKSKKYMYIIKFLADISCFNFFSGSVLCRSGHVDSCTRSLYWPPSITWQHLQIPGGKPDYTVIHVLGV